MAGVFVPWRTSIVIDMIILQNVLPVMVTMNGCNYILIKGILKLCADKYINAESKIEKTQ